MKKKILLMCLLPLSVPLAAQQMLTLDSAVEQTLGKNRRMTAAGYEERAAELERKAAIGLRMPKITVGGAYAYLGDDIAMDFNSLKPSMQNAATGLDAIFSGLAGAAITPVSTALAGSLSKDWRYTIQDRSLGFVGGTVTVPVFAGGKINAANRAARLNYETAVESGRETQNSLVTELAQRYYGLVLANQVVTVREIVLEGMKQHLEDAIKLEENGKMAKGERLYAEVKVAEAERELRNARLQAKTIATALANTLNDRQQYVPVSPLFVLDELPDLLYFRNEALARNPQLQQVALKRDLAQENVKVHRADFLPQVALVGGMNFYDYQLNEAIPNWAVGATASWTIFDGISREHKYGAAKNTVRRVEALRSQAEEDICTFIEQLYNELWSYQNQMPSIDSSLAFAQEYLRIKEAAFREGIAPSSDVVDARLNLAAIRAERIQTAYYFDITLARLLETAGLSEEFPTYARSLKMTPVVFE